MGDCNNSPSTAQPSGVLLDHALDQLNDVVYLLGPDGNLQWYNDRLREVTGFPAEEIEEMAALDFFPEGERARIDDAIDTVLDVGEGVVEADIRTAGGDRLPHEFTGDRVTDEEGNLIGIVGSARDISDRIERERRLRALNETGQELMAADTRQAVVEIGVDSACEILGFDANTIHLYDEQRDVLEPAAGSSTVSAIVGDPPVFTGEGSIAWRVFDRGEALAVGDVHDDSDVYNPDTDVRSELFLPIDDEGILIAASESVEDFDEEDLLLGEILVATIATALEQIDQRELISAREQELRRQNERLEEFASVVSHDLRNPLEVARGYVELASSSDNPEHLERASEALDRMDTLIDDLLTLAREGEKVGELEVVDLTALAESCWRTVETEEATLRTEADIAIQADESRVRQLLENLIRNAVEHGGESVTVKIGDFDGGFYVEDDGPGIPKEDQADVFNSGYSTSGDGTGYGLCIVQQVADAHGWNVRVVDGNAGGARFEITDVTSDE